MRTMIVEMSQMSDSRELYHSRPPVVCVAFLYAVFVICVLCFVWVYTGQINLVVEGNATTFLEAQDADGRLAEEETLWAQMSVSSSEIQWIEPGMEVIFSVEALPSSEYGYAYGTLVEISPNLSLDENGQGYYTAKIRLNTSSMTGRNGKEVPLQKEMRCEARILAGTQRVMTYLQGYIK